ncbi:hypothetical protein, partial [Pseudohongiella sp.]
MISWDEFHDDPTSLDAEPSSQNARTAGSDRAGPAIATQTAQTKPASSSLRGPDSATNGATLGSAASSAETAKAERSYDAAIAAARPAYIAQPSSSRNAPEAAAEAVNNQIMQQVASELEDLDVEVAQQE